MDRQKKKVLIKEKIIEAAFDLLKEQTWESISSNEICKRAEISKRTLYVYFQSQDEIYLELVSRSFNKITNDMGIAFAKGSTANEKIMNLGVAYLNFMVNEPIAGALIVGFDEMRFIENYPEQVKTIGDIANRYELLHVFQQLNLDPKAYDRTLALYLWAHIQGIAQLIVCKRMWLEHYYEISVKSLIEEQMIIVEKILLGAER